MALDTPTTWETFRTSFLKIYSPALLKRKREGLSPEGSSGRSVTDEMVAQQPSASVLHAQDVGRVTEVLA
ncbi:hypothetical protein SESBI_07459 [Sesbania bispinosa]|nr:hypothetical protein SESBI_07459 [Sesbania bispinosa]